MPRASVATSIVVSNVVSIVVSVAVSVAVSVTLSLCLSCSSYPEPPWPQNPQVVATAPGRLVTVRVLEARYRSRSGERLPWFKVTVENTHTRRVHATIETVLHLAGAKTARGPQRESHPVSLHPSETKTVYERRGSLIVSASLLSEREADRLSHLSRSNNRPARTDLDPRR